MTKKQRRVIAQQQEEEDDDLAFSESSARSAKGYCEPYELDDWLEWGHAGVEDDLAQLQRSLHLHY
jgi:hypothetical protein